MDLTLLSALLQELLIKNKRVALPGMGTFVLEDLPSVFLLDGRAITPPSKKVYFKTADIKDDGVLEGAYARKHGVSLEEAKGAVSLLVKEIRATLIENLKVNIPNFGSISFGESYSFHFTMDDHFNVSPDTYPLEAISLKPEKTDVPTVREELQMEEKQMIESTDRDDELRMKSYNDIISEWHKAAEAQEVEEDHPKVTMRISKQIGIVDDRMSDPPKYDYTAVDSGEDKLIIGEEKEENQKEVIAGKQDECSADFVLDEAEPVQRMTDEADVVLADKMDDNSDAGYEIVDLSTMEMPATELSTTATAATGVLQEEETEAVGAVSDLDSGLDSGVVSETEHVAKKEQCEQQDSKVLDKRGLKELKANEKKELKERKAREEKELKERKAREERELKERKIIEEKELKERKIREERELKERKTQEQQALKAKAKQEKEALKGEKKPVKINKWIWISLIAVVLVIGLLCAVYLFREDLKPVLEKLLYSKEELEILRQTGRM